jgi:soluble lytic murein transglycosylase
MEPGTRPSFLKTVQRFSPQLLIGGLSAIAVLGSTALLLRWFPQRTPQPMVFNPIPTTTSDRITTLSFQPTDTRRASLETLTKEGTGIERQQARYLLAADAVRQGKGTEALRWLEHLEKDYPNLAPDILALRAKAYKLSQKNAEAKGTWLQLVQQFPKQPAAAEALYVLGQSDPKYWDQAIAEMPAHPRTLDIVTQRLKTDPKNLKLLKQVAQYGQQLPNYRAYLDTLVKTHAKALQAEDWQTIAFGYWEKQHYQEAGQAYRQAPKTSRNLFRIARGLQLGGESGESQSDTGTAVDSAKIAPNLGTPSAAYERMIAAFPNAPETPRALLKLADLTKDANRAAVYYDRSVTLAKTLKRPQEAGDALLLKANRLQAVNVNAQAAAENRLLNEFSPTDAAADLRWKRAWDAAQAKEYNKAQDWAAEVVKHNAQSDRAAKALFWIGKWAERLGNPKERQDAFTQLWNQYPESYYTWRAASLSGAPVGTFQTVRSLRPTLHFPSRRLPLGVKNQPMQELYLMGEAETAWEHWQTLFKDRETPSFDEQLTDGILRIGVEDYLDGMFMVSNLRDRVLNEPELQAQQQTYQDLRKNPGYWQTLFPIPYWSEISRWANEHQVDPVLVLGLMRQESRFQPKIRSIAGAMGLMQLMPETAAQVAAGLKLKTYSLEKPDDNIRLGTWYLNSTHQTYQDNSMLAIASYNAGPGNVAQWLKELDISDADQFVESIPFSETRDYVKSVLGNYWNYLRLYNPQLSKSDTFQ